MIALCSFTDLHSISLLLYKSADELWFKNYPYVYNKEIFSSSFSQDAFYQSLFTAFCNEHGVSLSSCDVLMTGFLEPPKLGIPIKMAKSLYEIVAAVKGSYPILVNNTSIFTPDFCFSATSLNPTRKSTEFGGVDEDNYYANLEIYPQLITNEISTQIDLDSNVAALLEDTAVFPKGVPLVYCGSRFSRLSIFPELDYLLMLNLIKEPGIYEIKCDSFNTLILTTLLNIYDPNVTIMQEIPVAANVVSSPSAIECMIKTDAGTSQLVQLEKGKTTIIPMAKNEVAKIMLKSYSLGTVEYSITGGGAGLVIDTREDKRVFTQNLGLFSANLKGFTGVASLNVVAGKDVL